MPVARSPGSMRARLGAALVLLLCTVAGLVLALMFVILPDPAPRDFAPVKPTTQPLTRHLLFVVVDGLRYDVATSAAKMPRFAQAMRQEAHAEVWAGQVTMTTSAILSYGTGRPGRFEQILRNLDPSPPPHNSWLENAKVAGLSLASVGDPAWPQMYGAHLVDHRDDPKGASIDVDFNDQTFRDTRDLLRNDPNVLVSHYVTPDHQGHAFGVLSQRYIEHVRGFDRKLFKLLDELPKDWTVVVTSDHGAVDSGTHGSDTPVQRRCPAFAYGPGIVRGAAPDAPVPQVDLAPTLALLLGVAPPAHGQGLPLTEWLDLPDTARAEVACVEAQRVTRYGALSLGASDLVGPNRALTGCASERAASERLSAAKTTVREVNAALSDATGIASPKAWLTGAIVFSIFVVIVVLVFGRSVLARVPFALAWVAIATWLVLDVERLPGLWSGRVRMVLFVATIAPALTLVLRPRTVASLAERRPLWVAAYLPGLLVVGYPSNVQPLAWVAVLVLGALLVRSPDLSSASASLLTGRRGLLSVALLLFAFVVLLRVGTRASGMMPSWYGGDRGLMALGASVAAGVWYALRSSRALGERLSPRDAGIGLAMTLSCFALREVLFAWMARGLVIGFVVLALFALRAGRKSWALNLGLCSYVLLARLWEVPWVIATLLAAGVVGATLEQKEDTKASPLRQIVLVSFLFCLMLVQRLALQGTQDFGGMDLGAGGFGDVNVPASLVGVFLGYKYVLCAALLLLAGLGALTRDQMRSITSGLFAAFLLRAAALLAMLFVAGGSYWTGLRVLGEVPFALLFAALLLVVLLVAGERAQLSSGSSSS
ncbi:MAG: alkaline phosphatase family protein [Polyangiaceae bacterium]